MPLTLEPTRWLIPSAAGHRMLTFEWTSYVERSPLPGMAGLVRTVWIQRTGEAAYVQRHLPTGGAEIHFPIGGITS